MSDWRTITAEQYMTGGVAAGDYDEAFIRDHDGWWREVWDVGCTTDEAGNVVIYTAAADPLLVAPSHPIRVR